VFEVIGLSLGRLSADTVPAGKPVKLSGRGTILAYDMPGPGDAPTLLLLHGLGASGLLNWFPAFGPLSERFRVVAMDLRGHGHGLRSGSRYRLTDCADDAIALMDALEVERCIPVGYSLGGPVAQLMWRHHRDRVDGLVLCATSRNFRGKPHERWGYWSDGCGELLSFCAECARREFADHAPASRLVLLVHRPCRRSLIQLRRPLDAEARLTVAGCQARLAKSYALSGAPPPEARRCDS